MEKKLVSVVLAAILFPLTLCAQDYEMKGDAAVKRGDYTSAIENFEAQLSYMKFKKVDMNSREFLMLEKKCSKATECKTLRSKAASITKKLNVDFYDVLSQISKSKGDEAVVTWKANIKNLTNIYNVILSKFPDDANTKSLLAAVNKYQTKIDQAYFDAYIMPEKWSAVQRVGTKEAYQAFLVEYPEGRFADMAYQAIHKQEDDALWANAVSKNTKGSYEAYILAMPRGAYIAKATDIIVQIEEDNAFWSAAVEANSIEGYNAYLQNTPNGFNKIRATANLKILQAKRDFEKGQAFNCSINLKQFRGLNSNPVNLLLEQNVPIYFEVSEDFDYSSWRSNKDYKNAKNYIALHPDGVHYDEIAKYYIMLLCDSWDFLPPDATPEQISYLMSLTQDESVRSEIQKKVMENVKLNVDIESSSKNYASYTGQSKYCGFEKASVLNSVVIYINDKPEKMAPAKIYVDGEYIGDNRAKVKLVPGYHTIKLEGWAYTKASKYEAHKDTPTHIATYVIKISNMTTEQSFEMKCPGGGTYRSKKTFAIVGQVVGYAAIIGGAVAIAVTKK